MVGEDGRLLHALHYIVLMTRSVRQVMCVRACVRARVCVNADVCVCGMFPRRHEVLDSTELSTSYPHRCCTQTIARIHYTHTHTQAHGSTEIS